MMQKVGHKAATCTSHTSLAMQLAPSAPSLPCHSFSHSFSTLAQDCGCSADKQLIPMPYDLKELKAPFFWL